MTFYSDLIIGEKPEVGKLIQLALRNNICCTNLLESLDLFVDTNSPLLENNLSQGTDVAGIERYFLAILESCGYSDLFSLHQFNGLPSNWITGWARYLSNSGSIGVWYIDLNNSKYLEEDGFPSIGTGWLDRNSDDNKLYALSLSLAVNPERFLNLGSKAVAINNGVDQDWLNLEWHFSLYICFQCY